MTKTLKSTVLVPLASLAAFALLPAPVNADGGDYLLPVVATIGEFDAAGAEPNRESNTCAEARRVAWFLHELERSDGEVSPAADFGACNREIYAHADE